MENGVNDWWWQQPQQQQQLFLRLGAKIPRLEVTKRNGFLAWLIRNFQLSWILGELFDLTNPSELVQILLI